MSPVHPDTLAVLTSGIQAEVASYVFYLEAVKKSPSDELKDMWRELAADEKQHFQILERQYDSLVRSEKWISTADILKKEGLPEIGEDMTRRHQDLVDQVAKAEGIIEVLEIALRLEKEANGTYTKGAEIADSAEGKEMFERLAKFELGHVRKIQGMIEKYS